MATNFIDIERSIPEATMPVLHCPMASAYHLFSSETLLMDPGEKRFVDTGVAIKIPQNFYGQIVGRQTMLSIGADVANTILDPNNFIRVRVLIVNNSGHELPIMIGDKIAALLVMPCDQLLLRSISAILDLSRH